MINVLTFVKKKKKAPYWMKNALCIWESPSTREGWGAAVSKAPSSLPVAEMRGNWTSSAGQVAPNPEIWILREKPGLRCLGWLPGGAQDGTIMDGTITSFLFWIHVISLFPNATLYFIFCSSHGSNGKLNNLYFYENFSDCRKCHCVNSFFSGN